MQTFHLKKIWFDKIKSGEKTHEYRRVCDYWNKRIISSIMPGDIICFALGYPPADADEKIIFAIVIEIKTVSGHNTDLKIDETVWDIEFEVISE